MLDSNTWNHLTVCKQMSSGSFKNNVAYKIFAYKLYTYIYIYIYSIFFLKEISKTHNRMEIDL